eukprot:9498588-Pyramimonas_sp.AAC.1
MMKQCPRIPRHDSQPKERRTFALLSTVPQGTQSVKHTTQLSARSPRPPRCDHGPAGRPSARSAGCPLPTRETGTPGLPWGRREPMVSIPPAPRHGTCPRNTSSQDRAAGALHALSCTRARA